MYRRKKEIET